MHVLTLSISDRFFIPSKNSQHYYIYQMAFRNYNLQKIKITKEINEIELFFPILYRGKIYKQIFSLQNNNVNGKQINHKRETHVADDMIVKACMGVWSLDTHKRRGV